VDEMNIGQRLKQERQRLGFTQAQFSAGGGVAPNAQLHYEKGSRQPRADYLSSLNSIGVDVLYVVTGVRMPGASSQIPADEVDLILHLKALTGPNQNAILGIAKRLSDYVTRLRQRELDAY
jgi:transcriptional regulator with XRE-family HTH domain